MAVFYDTHAHLDFPDFAQEIPALLDRAHAAGIDRIITIGTDLESSRQSIRLAEAHPEVFAVIGWHPGDAMAAPEDIREDLAALAQHPKVVAIGETGLDYYRLPSKTEGASPEVDARYKAKQAALFRQQLEVAAAAGLNCVIHERGDALADVLPIMEPYREKLRGVFHCFVGTPQAREKIKALGSMISFTGIVTFKNAEDVRITLKSTPLGEFMLETDAPFLAPTPYRGKRCESAYVKEIAEKVAEIKGCSLEELSRSTCAAAHAFFPKLN